MRINTKKRFALAGLLLTGTMLSPQALALDIFACEPEYAALAQELAPDAKIFSATTALQDPHYVQARPSLIAKLRKADLAVCAGAELEVGWLPMLQMKANNPAVRDGQPGMFYADDHVETLDKRTSVSRIEGDVHPDGNPHLQFSPTRIEQLSLALAERLSQLDPGNARDYHARQQDFATRWQSAVARWEQQAMPLKGTKVVAYHTNYRYLFDWLGMEQAGDLEPKPGLPPTAGHLAELVNVVKAGSVAMVIHSGHQDERGAQWLSERTGVPVVRLPMGPGSEGIDDLFALYDAVLNQLLAVK